MSVAAGGEARSMKGAVEEKRKMTALRMKEAMVLTPTTCSVWLGGG